MKVDYGITKYATENKIEANKIYRIISRTKNYFKLVDENNLEIKISISENNDNMLLEILLKLLNIIGKILY